MNSLSITNFLGGVNEAVDESMIAVNEASYCVNADIIDGTLKTRKMNTNSGHVLGSQAGLELVSGVSTFDGYEEYIILSANNDYVYKFDLDIASRFTAMFGGIDANSLDFINFQNGENRVVLFADGYDNIRMYDSDLGTWRRLKDRRIVYYSADSELLEGIIVREVNGVLEYYTNKGVKLDGVVTKYIDANGAEVSSLEAVLTYSPKVKYIELHYDRIFGAGDFHNPDRLYFSTAGVNGPDLEDWTAPISEGEANQHGGFIDVPTWDGGRIIGLKTVFNDLLIFKNKQIFKLFATYPGNYQIVPLFSSSGAISDKSIVVTPNGCYFAASDGIYRYDGTNVTNISNKVRKTYESLNLAYMGNSTAIFYDNKYFLAVPKGTSTVNNFVIVYDTLRYIFTFMDGIIVKQFLVCRNKLFFLSNTAYVHELFTDVSASYDEVVNMKWESAGTDLGAKNVDKIIEYIYFTGSGNGDVKITVDTDWKSGLNAVYKIKTLGSTEEIHRIRLRTKGKRIKLKIENVNGSKIVIKSPQIMYEVEEDL